MKSRYVLRTDIAYDWNFTIDDLALDTLLYKDDHLHEFSKKNARLEPDSHHSRCRQMKMIDNREMTTKEMLKI